MQRSVRYFIVRSVLKRLFHLSSDPNKTILKQTAVVISASSFAVGCMPYSYKDNIIHNDVSNAIISDTKLIDRPYITQTFTPDALKLAMVEADIKMSVEPVCNITVFYMNHTTTGLKGEATNATGAVMIPSGDNPDCHGERPLTLYAHATSPVKSYNLAALNDPNNAGYRMALRLASNFAGHGDIVIAPNYPGYHGSRLDYVPYVSEKQGRQMLDGLQAGMLAIDQMNQHYPDSSSPQTTYGDKLFVSGYSEGGYVAMAAAKALDEVGRPATAVSPGSGPYAMAAYADSIMDGNVVFGATIFLPMIASSYRVQYAEDYKNLIDDIFTEKYQNVPNLFVTNKYIPWLLFRHKLPLTQLFQSTPTGYEILDPISPPKPEYAYGFDDTNYLIRTDFRANYVEDMLNHPDAIYSLYSQGGTLPASLPNDATTLATDSKMPFRKTFIDNDLRDYTPIPPVLLCGGNQDPTVTYDINANAQALLWRGKPQVKFALVDVDTTNKNDRDNSSNNNTLTYISTLPAAVDNGIYEAIAKIQGDFSLALQTSLDASYKEGYDKAIADGKSIEQAITQGNRKSRRKLLVSYHEMAVPYCMDAANVFFDQYR